MTTTHDNIDLCIIHRPGNLDAHGNGKHERYSVDFIINGQSLFKQLFAEKYDFIGRFSPDTLEWNEENAAVFLLKRLPDLENGRVMLYVCPECADIGCGAITAKISKINNIYSWSDFAYENNYDPDMTDYETYKNIGPFAFDIVTYQQIIQKAKAIKQDN